MLVVPNSLKFLLLAAVGGGIAPLKHCPGGGGCGGDLLGEQASPACPDDLCPGLGNGFFLPNINAYSVNTGGAIIFKERGVGQCASVSAAEQNNRAFKDTDSMEKFVNDVVAAAEIGGSYNTALLSTQGTVQTMTGNESVLAKTFHSATLDINVVTHAVDFLQSNECFSEDNLADGFLEEFEALASVLEPSLEGSWSPYESFLRTFGSHVMMQQQIGSRFQQWESSMSSSSDILDTLKIKACAEVEGTTLGGGWSTEACAAYSSEEKNQALKAESESRRVILGGTQETRAALTKAVTQESLNAFVDSADEGQSPVRFIFEPIWQLLSKVYQPACAESPGSRACENLQRASNLQAAYEGWMAFKCPRLETANHIVYQEFQRDAASSQGIWTYRCWAKKTGCNDGGVDCHMSGSSYCYCHGPSCIEVGDSVAGAGEYRDRQKGEDSGRSNEGANNSCNYHFIAHCNCDHDWAGGLPDRSIWTQGQ